MLLAALGATIIGFILLVVALVTAQLWLAIACVVVSVIGVALLLADVLTYRRGDRDRTVSSRLQDDGSDSDEDGAATAASPGVTPSPAVGPSAPDNAVDDATREASTVGSEQFGHHEPATTDPKNAPKNAPERSADDVSITTQFPAVTSTESAQDWSTETPADTDRQFTTRGLYARGDYDPDHTDQIPRIEIERALGADWEPPESSGSK